MQIWTTIIHALQLITALTMIGLVLIQHGKGADMGASFGSGASGSLFGASGSANFLSRSTAACAAVFFACTLALAFSSNDRPQQCAAEQRQRARSCRARGQCAGRRVIPGVAPAASAPAAQVGVPRSDPCADCGTGQRRFEVGRAAERPSRVQRARRDYPCFAARILRQ